MRTQLAFFICGAFFLIGCVADKGTQLDFQTRLTKRGQYLLSDTNAPLGASYDVVVYVVERDDTVPGIAKKFDVSTEQLLAINPGVNPYRLYIGDRLRIIERRRQ